MLTSEKKGGLTFHNTTSSRLLLPLHHTGHTNSQSSKWPVECEYLPNRWDCRRNIRYSLPVNLYGIEISIRRDADSDIHRSKKHQKRLSAPSHWLLDKLSGTYAPKPSAGPHKLRDCLPLIVFIRNRLKYALNFRETRAILMQRLIKVDGKVRTDMTYPAGFMDVITIDKTGENFRLVYDTKGRFTVHRIQAEEAEYKLGKVKRVQLGRGGIPFLVTHDART